MCLWSSKADRLGIVVPDMKLSPNVGSDRSWVWNAAADVSEGEPEPCTLAIRFANSESEFPVLYGLFQWWLTTLQTPTSSKKHSSRPSRKTRPYSRLMRQQSQRRRPRRPRRKHRRERLEKHSEGFFRGLQVEISGTLGGLLVCSVARTSCV